MRRPRPTGDELGFVPLSRTSAEMLFEGFSQRNERGSASSASVRSVSVVHILVLRSTLGQFAQARLRTGMILPNTWFPRTLREDKFQQDFQ
jgi:hypothetical protein